MTRSRIFPATFLAGAFALALHSVPGAAQTLGPYSYYAVTPCRVVDTRCATGAATASCPLLDTPNGLPALAGNGPARSFKMRGNCGVPVSATAVSLNATILPATTHAGYFFLTLWPSGGTMPVVSTLNFTANDLALANGAIVPLSANTNDLSAYVATFDTANLVLDVTGYFAP